MKKMAQRVFFAIYVALHCFLIYLGWVVAVDYLSMLFQINLGILKAFGWLAAIAFVILSYRKFKDGSYFQFMGSATSSKVNSKIQAEQGAAANP